MGSLTTSQFGARITGIGSAFPEKRVSNDDIVKKLGASGIETNDRWIRERTGISERRIADMENPAEHNFSLGLAAAQKALEMEGKTEKDVDHILYARYTCSINCVLASAQNWGRSGLGNGYKCRVF